MLFLYFNKSSPEFKFDGNKIKYLPGVPGTLMEFLPLPSPLFSGNEVVLLAANKKALMAGMITDTIFRHSFTIQSNRSKFLRPKSFGSLVQELAPGRDHGFIPTALLNRKPSKFYIVELRYDMWFNGDHTC